MSTLLLIYDDNCPLCQWYSGMFVKTGLLPARGRLPYSGISSELQTQIDIELGRNQIPLIDQQTGQVWYGIDALLEILGRRFAWIRSTGRQPVVYWLLTRLYRLISYNRKVVVASKCGAGQYDCAPDFSKFYRFLFLLLTLLLNTGLLAMIHHTWLQHLPAYTMSMEQLQLMHFGFVGINLVLAVILKRERAWEYLGQVTMLALLAQLLLLPLLCINVWIAIPAVYSYCYMGFVALFIFREYLRRMDYAGILYKHRWIAAFNLLCMAAFVFVLFKF